MQSEGLNGSASQEVLAGIGIFLAPNRKGQFMITKISPDGAAFQSKEIEVGDLLVQVNGTALEGLQIEEVRQYITGPPNSKIDLQLLRPIVDQLSGVEELKPIFVNLIRTIPANQLSARDRSPQRYDSPSLKPAKPGPTMNGPMIGQAFAQYNPAQSQASDSVQSQKRAPTLLRSQTPARGPGPLYSGVERSSFVMTNNDLVQHGEFHPFNAAFHPQIVNATVDSQYSTVSQTIAAPEPRRTWPLTNQSNNATPMRYMTPQRPSSAKRGSSPGAPGIGLYGVGIVLQNDLNGDLRVMDITPGGPADTQGCLAQIGDIVVALDGRNVRGLSAQQARELVLGRHGTPIEIRILRQDGFPYAAFPTFRPLSFILLRGVNKAHGLPLQGSRNSSVRQSARTPSPSPYRAPMSPRMVPTAPASSQKGMAVNEHMCGIGVFIERVHGALVVKTINPKGPAGQVPPTYLFPGDFLVAIDGELTQTMTMKEVRDKIVGKRGTYVTLSLRRFMPNNGQLSHVFETKIQRELPPPAYGNDEVDGNSRTGVGRGPLIPQSQDKFRGTTSLSNSSVDLPGPVQREEKMSGVGIHLMDIDQVLMVKELQPGSAAERSGLIGRGDVLHRIDYQKVEGLSLAEVMAMMQGPPKSSVVLGFVKPRHRLQINVRLSREQSQANAMDTAPTIGLFRTEPMRNTPAKAEPVRLGSTMPIPMQTPGPYRPWMPMPAQTFNPYRRPTPLPSPFMFPGFQPLMLPGFVF